MKATPAAFPSGVVLVMGLARAVTVRADSLALSPTSGALDTGGAFRDLPPSIAYGAAVAALLLFATLAYPRARRADRRDDIVMVVVRPPSARGESGRALRAALVITLAAFAFGALRAIWSRSSADSPLASNGGMLAPFQVASADVAPSLRATYRDLQQGLIAVERAHATTGRWPSVTTLAADGAPPFAPSAPGRVAYTWTLYADDTGANYLGTPPDGSIAPAMLLAIIDPSLQPDAVGDMHRLSSGASVRVSVWFRPAGIAAAPPTGVVARPARERWMQIAIGTGE